MPIVWQHTSMKRDLKHSLMPSQKWRSLILHSSLTATIILPSMVNVMSMKKTAVSSVWNQDISHNIALTLDAISPTNMVIFVMDCPHRIPP